MSAGELFELIKPIALVVSALVSTWILISARRRYPFYLALAWAGTTFLYPLVVFPLYLVSLLFRKKPRLTRIRGRFLVPFVYMAIMAIGLAIFFYYDDRSVDAHLSRAAVAKVNDDRLTAIREYRAALKLEDNAHTHKLLAIALYDAGFLTESVTEFRAAELQGEPDDAIHYRLGVLLERIDLPGQALLELKQFLITNMCFQKDPRCEYAQTRVEALDRLDSSH